MRSQELPIVSLIVPMNKLNKRATYHTSNGVASTTSMLLVSPPSGPFGSAYCLVNDQIFDWSEYYMKGSIHRHFNWPWPNSSLLPSLSSPFERRKPSRIPQNKRVPPDPSLVNRVCSRRRKVGLALFPFLNSVSSLKIREYILDYCATIFTKVYSITNVFPRWLLVIVSGSVASFLVRLLHKSSSNASKVPKAESSPKSTIVTSDEKKPSTSAPAPEPVTETTNTLSNGTATTSTSKLQTDSERESSAKPTKRTSTRPKKSKKT